MCLYSLCPMTWYGGVFCTRNKCVEYSWPGFGLPNYFCFLRLLLQCKVNLIFIMILTAIVWTLLHFLLQLPNHTWGLGCPFSLLDIWGGLFLPPSVRAVLLLCHKLLVSQSKLYHFRWFSFLSCWGFVSRADTFLVLKKVLVLSLPCLPFSWIPVSCSRTWFSQF